MATLEQAGYRWRLDDGDEDAATWIAGQNSGSGTELVTNGEMEDGDPPTGWSANNNPETFERSGVQKHGGSYSAHIVDSTPSYGGFYRAGISWPYGTGLYLRFSFWDYL